MDAKLSLRFVLAILDSVYLDFGQMIIQEKSRVPSSFNLLYTTLLLA